MIIGKSLIYTHHQDVRSNLVNSILIYNGFFVTYNIKRLVSPVLYKSFLCVCVAGVALLVVHDDHADHDDDDDDDDGNDDDENEEEKGRRRRGRRGRRRC